MNKKIALAAAVLTVAIFGAFLFWIRPAWAWTYALSGEAKCERGEWHVTWKVDNTTENEPLHILSSTRAAVPTGDVPANSVGEYTEIVTTDVDLTLTANWSGDQTVRERHAEVKLVGECEPEGPDETPPVVVPPTVRELPNTSIKE